MDNQDTVLWSTYVLQTTVENVYIKKIQYIYVISRTQRYFIALMATRFGSYDHHQANAIQNLKRLVKCIPSNVKLCWIPFTSVSIFVNSLKLLYNVICEGAYCREL